MLKYMPHFMYHVFITNIYSLTVLSFVIVNIVKNILLDYSLYFCKEYSYEWLFYMDKHYFCPVSCYVFLQFFCDIIFSLR